MEETTRDGLRRGLGLGLGDDGLRDSHLSESDVLSYGLYCTCGGAEAKEANRNALYDRLESWHGEGEGEREACSARTVGTPRGRSEHSSWKRR